MKRHLFPWCSISCAATLARNHSEMLSLASLVALLAYHTLFDAQC